MADVYIAAVEHEKGKCLNLSIQSTSNVIGFQNPVLSSLLKSKALEYQVFGFVDVQGKGLKYPNVG